MDNDRLQRMYQETILEHNKNPRNFGKLDPHTHFGHGKNPLCGDDYELYLNVKDGVIESVGFDGQGCAISTSSASMLTTMVKGKTIEEAKALTQAFLNFIIDDGQSKEKVGSPAGEKLERIVGESEKDVSQSLGRLKIFEGVKQFPVRVKCCTLSWRALEQALLETDIVATTE